jgi:outer membrane protein TolC
MAENRAQDEAREVSQILHDSWMRWNSARSSFLISIQIVKNGTQTLEIATQKLASGAINSIDFRDIQLQLINAKQQQVQSLYLWQFEDVELRRLSGEWIFKSMDE